VEGLVREAAENGGGGEGPAPDLLTTGEVARYCAVSTNAVKKWIRQGDLPAFQTPGGHFRVRRAEFRRFLVRHRMPVLPDFFPPRPARVLIADDEPVVRDLVRELVLAASPGPIEVETAEDGYDALLKVGDFKPDLLILDLKMPRMDGFEACRTIRDNPQTSHIRIVAMTGFAGGGNRERILAAGALCCFDKPLPVGEFLETVRRLLPLGDAPSASVPSVA
jgi:excisionase family DNA binding protein